MKQRMQGLTIAVTGDFGESRGHDKMKQWILHNGGRFASEISPRVTHLICSKEHYKKSVSMVKRAILIKTIYIVSFDWLEDSLMKGRPRNERDYLISPRVKTEAATKARRKLVRKQNIKKGMEAFGKSVKDFEQDMHSTGYGIYYDPTDKFPYDITLVRPSLLDNTNERYHLKVCLTSSNPTLSPKRLYVPPHCQTSTTTTVIPSCTDPLPINSTPLIPLSPPNRRARILLVKSDAQRLQLYVSHSVPKYFSCYVKYSASKVQHNAQMLAPIGSGWETAWGAFEAFFRLKTGRLWSEREFVTEGKGWFEYRTPRPGEPRGMGFVDHEGELDKELERLKELGVEVGKEWTQRTQEVGAKRLDEWNGGEEVGQESSLRNEKVASQHKGERDGGKGAWKEWSQRNEKTGSQHKGECDRGGGIGNEWSQPCETTGSQHQGEHDGGEGVGLDGVSEAEGYRNRL